MNRNTVSRALRRATAVAAFAAMPAALLATVPTAAQASSHCRGKVACIAAPGVQLNVDRVQLWGPTGSAINGQALIAVWVDVVDKTGPKPPNTYALGSMSPGALDPNYSESYWVIDATHDVNADYGNGCTYQAADPETEDVFLSGPYGFTFDKLLYPHQSEKSRAICFAVNDPSKPFKLVWYPNGKHLDNGKWAKSYSVRIPAAKAYEGAPVPVN